MRGVRVLAGVLAGLAALSTVGCGSDSGPELDITPDNTLVAVRDGTESRLAFAKVFCIELDDETSVHASTGPLRNISISIRGDGAMTVLLDLRNGGDDLIWGNPVLATYGRQGIADPELGYEDLSITRDGDALILHGVSLISPRLNPVTLDGTLRCTEGRL